jgi:hypothetical protein
MEGNLRVMNSIIKFLTMLLLFWFAGCAAQTETTTTTTSTTQRSSTTDTSALDRSRDMPPAYNSMGPAPR